MNMRWLLLPALLLLGLALAVTYRVDPSGGPLTLEDEVAAAFALWAEVEDAELEARLDDAADTLIRYGDSARFGPDTVSLTLTRTEQNERRLEIVLSPATPAYLPRALLHETGILLGLSTSADGVMNPMLPAEAPAELSEQDRETFAALETFAPEDINRDGVVDFYDLIALARDFGRTGVNLAADISGNGVVDQADLELLRAAYVFGTPSDTPPADAAEPSPVPDLPPEDELFPPDPSAPPEDDDAEVDEPLLPEPDPEDEVDETVDDPFEDDEFWEGEEEEP